jgi:biotin carboxyl carrier protein
MKYRVTVKNRVHMVEVREKEDCRRIFWDGKPMDVDFIQDRTNPVSSMIIEGRPYEVSWKNDGESYWVALGQSVFEVRVSRGLTGGDKSGDLRGEQSQEVITAPMPGMVVTVKVEPNQEVKIGEPLLILEAMKMENELRSPVQARVHEVLVETGKKVEKGEKLLVLQK